MSPEGRNGMAKPPVGILETANYEISNPPHADFPARPGRPHESNRPRPTRSLYPHTSKCHNSDWMHASAGILARWHRPRWRKDAQGEAIASQGYSPIPSLLRLQESSACVRGWVGLFGIGRWSGLPARLEATVKEPASCIRVRITRLYYRRDLYYRYTLNFFFTN